MTCPKESDEWTGHCAIRKIDLCSQHIRIGGQDLPFGDFEVCNEFVKVLLTDGATCHERRIAVHFFLGIIALGDCLNKRSFRCSERCFKWFWVDAINHLAWLRCRTISDFLLEQESFDSCIDFNGTRRCDNSGIGLFQRNRFGTNHSRRHRHNRRSHRCCRWFSARQKKRRCDQE